jgi:hypothetical protein
MRSKTQMADAKPAKRGKLDVSASRKHNDERAIGVAPQESKTPNNVKRPNTSDKKVAAAASPKAPETPDTVVPAKVATPPSKPGPKANTERNHNRPVRRTRFAYSLHDNLH